MRWLILLVIGLLPETAQAQKAALARETADYVARKFGKDVAKIGTVKLATRMEALAVQHGDDIFKAMKRVGPQALHVAEQAGGQGIRLVVKYGDDAVRLAARPKCIGLVAKYGDNAAEALIKHGQIAEPLIESVGKPAVNALTAVSAQNGRRLAILCEEGKLAPGLIDVVARHGDQAADFVWRNKGALAVGAGLTAFLSNPQPFLSGAENLVKPVVELPGNVAVEVAKGTNWTVVLFGLASIPVAVGGWRWWFKSNEAIAGLVARSLKP